MDYYLYTLENSWDKKISLNEHEFDEIKHAFFMVRYLYDLEKSFDHVVENYYELEISLLQTATRYSMDSNHDPEWAHADFMNQVRKLMNFLSTTRSYRYQRRRVSKKLLEGALELYDELRTNVETISKSNLAFRFMEELRNHSQHFRPPMKSMLISYSVVDDGEEQNLQTSLSPFLDVDDLRADKEFPRKLIAEANPEKGKIFIKPLLSKYMSCLGEIQELFRLTFSEKEKKWSSVQSEAKERYLDKYPSNIPDLIFMINSHDNGAHPETYYFPSRAESHRVQLQIKNGNLSKIDKQFVTNRVKRKNA